MNKSIFISISFMLLVYMFGGCVGEESIVSERHSDSAKEQELLVARGEYLVNVIGCDHCHTPKKMTPQGPVPDLERRLMGYSSEDPFPTFDKNETAPGKWVLFNGDGTAAAGPWGISYSGNLTPDESGIGSWTFDHFRRSIKEGKYKGLENARPVMPPMPWEYYRNMTDEDLLAIFTYLKTIRPIKNVVPAFTPYDQIQ